MTKLVEFLTTLVTYPCLYISATATPNQPLPGAPEAIHAASAAATAAGGGAPGSHQGQGQGPSQVQYRGGKPEGRGHGYGAMGGGLGGSSGSVSELGGSGHGRGMPGALAPEVKTRLGEFPEGRALVALER